MSSSVSRPGSAFAWTAPVKVALLQLQDFYLLSARTFTGLVTRPFYGQQWIEQLDRLGVGSTTITVMTALFGGLASALQLSVELDVYGAKPYLGRALAVSMLRELGPVLIALVVAARVAAGIAAELGSMRVGQQVDALRVLGIDPVRRLAVPRVAATVIAMPILTVIGLGVALAAGFVVASLYGHLGGAVYWASVGQAFTAQNISLGMTKPVLFGLAISLVGCYHGLAAEGGTRGVGTGTTRAVVHSAILIFVLDFLITQLFITLFHWSP